MTDDQYNGLIAKLDDMRKRIDGLQTDMELRFATLVNKVDLANAVIAMKADMSQRMSTSDVTTVNHLRDIGLRFDAIETRLTRLESS